MESTPEERLSKLFVGGLNRETSKEGLQKYFEKFGEVSDCIVITESGTRESRGFGYVTMKDHNDVSKILDKKAKGEPHIIDGKECEVKRSIPKEKNNDIAQLSTNKIFIGGLPDFAKQEDVNKLIKSYIGKEPKSVALLMRKDDSTKNRGFCFVDLPTDDDADTLFCHRMIDMSGKKVEIKKADPRARGERGRGRGQVGRGYQREGQFMSNYYPGYAGSYMTSAYGAYSPGYGYGFGGYGGYSGYSSYPASPAYSYESAYGSYTPGYSAYDDGTGMYSQAASGYGPMKSYGMNGNAGYGNGARSNYRPY